MKTFQWYSAIVSMTKKRKRKKKIRIVLPNKTNPISQNYMERCLDMLFYDVYIAPFAPYEFPTEEFTEMQLVRLQNAAAQCRTIRPFILPPCDRRLVRRKAERNLTALLW